MSCICRNMALSAAVRPVFDIHCPVLERSSCFFRQSMHTHITCKRKKFSGGTPSGATIGDGDREMKRANNRLDL